MSIDPEFIRQASEAMASNAPQAQALGFRFVSVEPGRGSIQVPWREDLVGDPDTGVIAGGVVTSPPRPHLRHGDHLGRAGFMSTATLDLRIDYMRAAPPRAAASRDGPLLQAHPLDRLRPRRGLGCRTPRPDRHGPGRLHAQPARRMSEVPEQQLAAFLQRVPYIRFLGMRAELYGDEMTAVLPFAQHLIGNTTCRPCTAG
jgi:acyl-coenzyme A thioesterase PaaI-like protein